MGQVYPAGHEYFGVKEMGGVRCGEIAKSVFCIGVATDALVAGGGP